MCAGFLTIFSCNPPQKHDAQQHRSARGEGNRQRAPLVPFTDAVVVRCAPLPLLRAPWCVVIGACTCTCSQQRAQSLNLVVFIIFYMLYSPEDVRSRTAHLLPNPCRHLLILDVLCGGAELYPQNNPTLNPPPTVLCQRDVCWCGS